MSIGKVAIALASLVIIGLIIFAVIRVVLPGAFAYVGCAMESFLSPAKSITLDSCAATLKGEIKFDSKTGG